MRALSTLAMAFAFLLAGLPAIAGPPNQPTGIYSPVITRDPIVQSKGGCTAWYAGNGLVVTAAHCLKMGGSFSETFRFTDGTEATGTLAFLSNVVTGHDDIAVYRISETNIRPLKIDCHVPNVGAIIHMTGYPGLYGRSTVWGRVASEGPPVALGPWPTVIKINIASFGGFSGSPVMMESGEVVGILVGGMSGQMSLALAVATPRLCQLIGYEPAHV